MLTPRRVQNRGRYVVERTPARLTWDDSNGTAAREHVGPSWWTLSTSCNVNQENRVVQ